MKKERLRDIHSEAVYKPRTHVSIQKGGMSATLIHDILSGGGHLHSGVVKRSQTPKGAERVRIESMILSNLEPCPYIVKFKDSGHDSETNYLLMEHMKGRPLSMISDFHFYNKMVIPKAVLASMFIDMASALDYAQTHAVTLEDSDGNKRTYTRGIIHRDIKPGNIFATLPGMVKIFDWDLAAPVDDPGQNPFPRDPETDEIKISGTPLFMVEKAFYGQELTLADDVTAMHNSIAYMACYYNNNLPHAGNEDQVCSVPAIMVHLSELRPSEDRKNGIDPHNIADIVAHIDQDLGSIIREGMVYNESKRPSPAATKRELERWYTAHYPHLAADRHGLVGAYILNVLSLDKQVMMVQAGYDLQLTFPDLGTALDNSYSEKMVKIDDDGKAIGEGPHVMVFLDITDEEKTQESANALSRIMCYGDYVQGQETPFLLGPNALELLNTLFEKNLEDYKTPLNYTHFAKTAITAGENPLFYGLKQK